MESRSISKTPFNQLSNIIQLKLTENNYLTWKSLLLALFTKFPVADYVDGSRECPAKCTSRHNENNDHVNPAYTLWQDDDSTLILLINSTISDSVIPYFVAAQTFHELWNNIEGRFSQVSATHTIHV